MTKLQVLEIGPGFNPQAQYVFPDAEITTLDAWEDYKPDIVGQANNLPEVLGGRKFDVIFASHILEHIPYWDVDRVLSEWVSCINEGGSVHIVVPSLEWAARQILSEKPSRATIPHLYAGIVNPYDVHLGGFTLRLLRAKMEKAGLAIARSVTGDYTILIGEEEMLAEQHYVAGYKLSEDDRPPPKKE